MAFTIDSPTRFEYLDNRDGPSAIRAVEVEAGAIARSSREAVDSHVVVPEPSGYRVTHVFQVVDADEEEVPLQYVETMDIESWEHITPAIDVMMTRTRADGWTVSITVAELDLDRGG